MDLYIIHGWTYRVENWQPVLERLARLGIRAHLLRVPGLGTPSERVWTIDDYVEWANQQLPDGAIALGHSNGGRILLNLLARQPQKLSCLILLNSAGIYHASKKRQLFRQLAKTFSFLKASPFARKLVYRLARASDYNNAPPNMKQTLINMIESDKKLSLKNIQTPTILLWGQADQITPVSDAQLMATELACARLVTMPGWGHAPYLTHPDQLADAIVKLVRGDWR